MAPDAAVAEPMVRALSVQCQKCGKESDSAFLYPYGELPFVIEARKIRDKEQVHSATPSGGGCGGRVLIATEPVEAKP